MSAKFSAATEKALARIDAGETMYAAAKAEGVVYNTVWLAVQRRNGVKPKQSTSQKTKIENDALRVNGSSAFEAFVIADGFARVSPEYLEKHAAEAEDLKTRLATAFEVKVSRKGRPASSTTKKSTTD
jgi:hypothetical protein